MDFDHPEKKQTVDFDRLAKTNKTHHEVKDDRLDYRRTFSVQRKRDDGLSPTRDGKGWALTVQRW